VRFYRTLGNFLEFPIVKTSAWLPGKRSLNDKKKTENFGGTSHGVPQKVSVFSDHPKIFYRPINSQFLQWKIHGNYSGCGKILLKIRIDYFMLIIRSNKFQVILIVGSIKIKKILFESTKLKIIRGVDRQIGSTRNWNEVKVGSFLIPLYLIRSLG